MLKPLRKNPYLILAGLEMILYLPVSSFRFAVKNDLFTGYFPPRFHLSTFLHEGLFPLWNPYINYGLPLYGDITASAWNPVTLLIGATVGYNAYTMTLELLLAIYVAGICFYRFARQLGATESLGLMAAISYLGCGYFIGDLQHLNWVWGAALLPWCAAAWLRFIDRGGWRDLARAVLPFFLFLTIAHPGLMIGAAYFFLLWAIGKSTGLASSEHPSSPRQVITRSLLLLLALAVSVLGIAYGYGYNLMLSTRGAIAAAGSIAHAASTWPTWISILLPWFTVKNDAFFHTDPAVRNAYLGVLVPACLVYLLRFRSSKQVWWWTGTILFFVLVSGEFGWSAWLQHWLPGFSLVRLKGEFRIFAMFSALTICVSLWPIGQGSSSESHASFRKIIAALSYMFASVAVGSCAWILLTRQSLFFQSVMEPGIKGWLHALQAPDILLIQSLIQWALCRAFLKAFHKPTAANSLLVVLVMADLTLAAWMNLPFTGVGSRSVQDIQTMLKASPSGIPPPSLQATEEITRTYPNTDTIIGNWGLYAKQLAWQRKAAYPMTLMESREFFPKISDSLSAQPMLFSDSHGTVADGFVAWTPDHFAFITRMANNQPVYIKMNHHPGWNARVDDIPVAVHPAVQGLMMVEIPNGQHRVDLFFQDPLARVAQAYHALMLLLLVLFSLDWSPSRKAGK